MKPNAEVKVTYDLNDVFLSSKTTEVKVEQVNIESRVTRHVHTKSPFTVLVHDGGEQLAITAARLGSLGLINYNMPLERQVAVATAVKNTSDNSTFPNATLDASGRLVVAALVRAAPDAFDKATALSAAGVDLLFLEGNHLNARDVASTVERIRRYIPGLEVVAGNAYNDDTVRMYVESGADGIKMGGREQIMNMLGLDMLHFQRLVDLAAEASVAQIPITFDDDVKGTAMAAKLVGIGFENMVLRNISAPQSLQNELENFAISLKASIAYTGNDNLQSFIDNVEFNRRG